jgi:hypothetical protein
LILKLKHSFILSITFISLYLGAAALLFVIDIPVTLRVIFLLVVLADLYRVATTHALRHGTRAVQALRLNGKGELLLQRHGSRAWQAAQITSRFVHPKLVLLGIRPGKQRFASALVIAADAIDAQAFRRLRAALLAPPRTRAA